MERRGTSTVTSDPQTGSMGILFLVMLYLALATESRSISKQSNINSFDILGKNQIYFKDYHDDVENERFARSVTFKKENPRMQRSSECGAHFGYDGEDGPEKWGEHFPTCRGCNQSPVDLVSSTCHTAHDTAIQWRGYEKTPTWLEITNNGHTVQLKGKWAKECDVPCVRKRNSPYEFVFEQLHFHWGPNDSVGSEHTIDGARFPLEMHVVSYRKDLSSMKKAAETPGGLLVIGILFKVCDQQSSAVGRLVKEFCKVPQEKSTCIEPFPLSQVVPLFSKHYFAYNGSLTTPPCSEVVNWVVNKRPAPITSQELTKFRHFTNQGKLIKKNYRPTQPLNGRRVEEIK